MLHPDFPILEGHYQMTNEWSLVLPEKFNKRIEEGDLVIWKPGFTMYVAIWGNDDNKPLKDLLSWLKEGISKDASELKEESGNYTLRLSYRLNEDIEDKREPAYYGFVASESGYVQIAIYFDSETEHDTAETIWRSIEAINAP